ncbi:MAG: transporter [Chlorobiaceae bacterium]|jgi:hypothetical protein|nr:transporter [Chlorobiaceae bacterium]
MQKKTVLLAVAFLLCSIQAFAFMPFITDNAGTQGKGRAQIEVGIKTTRDRQFLNNTSSKWTTSIASATISYGLSNNIDLIADLPFKTHKLKKIPNNEFILILEETSAISDITLQIKWRFFNNNCLGLALKPSITLPSGDENKDHGTGRVCEGITLIATRETRNTALNINLGYTHNDYRLDRVSSVSNSSLWKASVASELNLIGNLWAAGDIGTQTSQEKLAMSNTSYILGGLIFGLDDETDINIGIKKPLNKTDLDSSTTFIGGVTMFF